MSRRRKIVSASVVMAVTLAAIVCVLPCRAAGGWTIEGASGRLDRETNQSTLQGVVMTNEAEGIVLECQLMLYSPDEEHVEFLERVRVTQNGMVIEADSGVFDMRTSSGSFLGSVSLFRPATDEEPYEIDLSCEELDLDAATDSFVAKRNAVIRHLDEDGEESVLWADLIEYEGTTRIVKLTDVAEASAPGLPDGSQVSAGAMEFSTETGHMDFTGIRIVLPPSDEKEEGS